MVSLIPIIIYLIILKSLDSFKLVKWKMLSLCLLSGVACCAAAYGLTLLAVPFYAPFVEELLKGIVALLLMRLMRIVFFAESLTYGAAIGAGFALLENIIYVSYNPGMLLTTAVFRGLGTSLLHIGCTALLLTLLLGLHREKKLTRLCLWPLAMVPSVAIHAAYNMQYFSSFMQMIMVIVVFLTIFLLISNYNEKRIAQWLDNSLTYDAQLLADIRHGRLADTKTGRYLVSVRNQFDAEVFFDMICYVQLYLELTIAAKSRIMLREAGLPFQETTEETERRKAMIKEFRTLRSNIGKTGEIILRPVVRISREDEKELL